MAGKESERSPLATITATPLRDQLGDALLAVGEVPATMPVEVFAQAGVLADAVLPVALRAAQNAARSAVLRAAALFEDRGRSLLDGAIMTGADAAALLRGHADTTMADAPATGYPPVFPWFELMDDEDRTEFLRDLAHAALAAPSTGAAHKDVEAACATWRGIAEAQHAHNTAPGPPAEAVDTAPQRDEEEDTPAGSQLTGAASTAQAEILRALQAYGHSDASALVVLARVWEPDTTTGVS